MTFRSISSWIPTSSAAVAGAVTRKRKGTTTMSIQVGWVPTVGDLVGVAVGDQEGRRGEVFSRD